MSWFLLILAGFFEIGFATCLGKMKTVSGNHAILWFIGFLVCLFISMFLLIQATKILPIGTSYAVWTGIGSVGTVIIGIIFFKESYEFWRLFFISTLILSIIGLKIVSK